MKIISNQPGVTTTANETEYQLHDSDDGEQGYNLMVCIEQEGNMIQGMSDVVYLDSGCN